VIDVDNLDPETMYIIINRDNTETFVRTPDGIGCFWYDDDQYEVACGDVCDYRRVMYFDSSEEFENYRYREND